MKNICFVALRRSGHHAIINWTLQQLKGTYLFLNDVTGYHYSRMFNKLPLGELVKNQSLIAKHLGHKHQVLSNTQSSPDFLVYNFEDERIEDLHAKNLMQGVEPDVMILCMRDAYNNMASRIQRRNTRGAFNEPPPEEAIKIWKNHAKHFQNNNTVNVNFNTWFVDRNYRQGLAEQLDLHFTDEGINMVGNWGQGSSFDKRSFDKQAQNMDVLSRYKHYIKNPAFLQLFDNEVKLLNKSIFGISIFTKIL